MVILLEQICNKKNEIHIHLDNVYLEWFVIFFFSFWK